MTEYIKLFWADAPEGEPSVILYEVDTDRGRLALRSIDVFVDGHTRNIADLYDGAIEITPIPTMEEFNAHVWGEEFHACLVEKAEFETLWGKNETADRRRLPNLLIKAVPSAEQTSQTAEPGRLGGGHDADHQIERMPGQNQSRL